jgi:hypothetical protein
MWSTVTRGMSVNVSPGIVVEEDMDESWRGDAGVIMDTETRPLSLTASEVVCKVTMFL